MLVVKFSHASHLSLATLYIELSLVLGKFVFVYFKAVYSGGFKLVKAYTKRLYETRYPWMKLNI